MIRLIPVFAALLLATPLAAQEAAPAPQAEIRLTLEQAMLLRCSAAFALVADRQIRGEEWALAYPPLAEQGREFFVQATARLIDELQISENVLAEVIYAEAGKLGQPNLDQVMPVCLTLLPPEPHG